MIEDSWRPRIKPEHGLRRTASGRIRLGGGVYGVAAEVDDPAGVLWTMLRCADGSRSTSQIVAEVLKQHPSAQPSVVRDSLAQVTEAGYLEDAAAPDPPQLTDRERIRYDRSRSFFRWIDLTPRATSWDPQLRLQGASVLVLGIGGTGGAAVTALVASGVGAVHCVDGDFVELSNLNRQTLYCEDDIGRPKADAAVERLRRLNSDVRVTGECRQVRSESDLAGYVAGCDVLVQCADGPADIRVWVNRACLRARRPWVNAGYHGPVATAAAYVPGRGPCFECNRLHDAERQPDLVVDIAAERANAVMAPTAGLSGQFAAHLTIALLTGVPSVVPGQVQGINLIDADHHFLIRYDPHLTCPACAGRPEAAKPA